jgi:hypothetical protein
MHKCFWFIVLLFSTSALFAENLPPNTTIIINRRMIINDSEYPFNFSGIKMYMSDLETENIQLHDKLLSTFKELESKDTTAFTLSVTGGVIGGIATVAGAAMIVIAINDSNSGSSPLFGPGMGCAIGGIFFTSICFVLTPIFGPNNEDFHKFVNKHNKLNDTPIQINLAPNFQNEIELSIICKL